MQVAVIIAKVARVDFPRQWPSLFNDLLGKLGSSDTLTTRRTYLVLHHVLKELSSKRLAPDQRAFADVSRPTCNLLASNAACRVSHIWYGPAVISPVACVGMPGSLVISWKTVAWSYHISLSETLHKLGQILLQRCDRDVHQCCHSQDKPAWSQ